MNNKESLLSMYEADAEQAYMSKTPFMKLPGDYQRMLDDQEQHRLEKERRAAAQTPTLTAEQLHKDPTYQRLAEHLWNAYGQGDARLPSYMTSKFGMPSKGKSSPQDKAEWLSQKLGTFNNSLSGMMIDLSKMKDAPFSDLKAFNDALKMYDASDTTVMQGVRAVALGAAEFFMFGGLGYCNAGCKSGCARRSRIFYVRWSWVYRRKGSSKRSCKERRNGAITKYC
jgi:hypothetical protein